MKGLKWVKLRIPEVLDRSFNKIRLQPKEINGLTRINELNLQMNDHSDYPKKKNKIYLPANSPVTF